MTGEERLATTDSKFNDEIRHVQSELSFYCISVGFFGIHSLLKRKPPSGCVKNRITYNMAGLSFHLSRLLGKFNIWKDMTLAGHPKGNWQRNCIHLYNWYWNLPTGDEDTVLYLRICCSTCRFIGIQVIDYHFQVARMNINKFCFRYFYLIWWMIKWENAIMLCICVTNISFN